MNEEAVKDQPEPGTDGKRQMTPLRTAMAIGLMVMTIAFLVMGLKMGSTMPSAESVDEKLPLKARLFQVDQDWQTAVGSIHGVDPSTRFTIAKMTKPQVDLLNSEHVMPLGSATVLEVREKLSILAVTWKKEDRPSSLDDLWVYATPAPEP